MSSISAGGATRYTVTSMNAREQLTGATYGGSLTATYRFDSYGYPTSTQTGTIQDYRYSFDPYTGNLSSRQNYLRGKSESFGYDNLDRLTSVTGPQNLTMTFQDNGNINTKSDIGTTPFEYGTTAGPYALSKVTSSSGVIPTAAQIVSSYNSFQKVISIGEDGNSASFLYNADHERAKMIQTGSNSFTRWYHGGSFMRETNSSGTKDYVYLGGDAYTAPVSAVTENGTTKYCYLLRDYLGNITHVYDTSDGTTKEYSFDAWGRRRNPADWGYDMGSEPELFAGRGFTSHEFLKDFNVYNMNGRLYDPLVGRFFSPDITIQAPDYTQNYNRYSYCLNNPLKFADPSGYKFYIRDVQHSSACLDWGDSFNPCGGGGLGLKWGDVGIPQPMPDNSLFGALDAISKPDNLGGTWSSESGTTIFNSMENAEQAVINYNNENNSWGAYCTYRMMQNDAFVNNIVTQTDAQKAAPNSLSAFYQSINFSTYYNAQKAWDNSLLASAGDKSSQRPFIRSPYGPDMESSSSLTNLKYWGNYLDSKLDGDNGGEAPGFVKFIANLNPLWSIPNGIKVVTTGSDFYNTSYKNPYSEGIWMIYSGCSTFGGLSVGSIIRDQIVPLMIKKTNLP